MKIKQNFCNEKDDTSSLNMLSKELKIFLSSTFVDLKEAREKILKFLNVLKSDILNMETFGSDETMSKDYCIQKVNESNFFIGIYAERYGSIDKELDMSLTEIEYHSAYKKLESNQLVGMLLYVLDSKATWLVENIDRSPKKVKKLQKFKKLIDSRHTVTRFLEVEELPFNILSDTIRKLELGATKIFNPKNLNPIVQRKELDKPVGMEFFSQTLAAFFYGRSSDIDKLNSQIINFNFSLLIGISGIGKTSLINAGIIPAFEALNWVAVTIRPLNEPRRNLKSFLWNTFYANTRRNSFEVSSRLHFFEKIGLLPAYLNALIRASSKKDFRYFLNLFTSAKHRYQIAYSFFLHEKIAALASENDYEYLKCIIIKELNTLTDSSYNSSLFEEIEFQHNDNRYFFAWIVFSAFFSIIKLDDKELLFEGLQYVLYTSRIAAIRGLYNLGDQKDLNRLVDMSIRQDSGKVLDSLITATRILDMKCYLKQGTLITLNAENIIEKNRNENDIFYPKEKISHSVLNEIGFNDNNPF